MDRSGPQPIRVFESGAILLYLAEKFGAFLPTEPAPRAECLSWLFWQMGSAPYLGGGFGHFYAYAPTKMEYPIDRFAMETSASSTCSTAAWPKRISWPVPTTPSPTWRSGPGTARW
jgi:glutathione S-transferase